MLEAGHSFRSRVLVKEKYKSGSRANFPIVVVVVAIAFAQFNINIWSRKGAGWGIRFWFSRPMFRESAGCSVVVSRSLGDNVGLWSTEYYNRVGIENYNKR
jgi:hypothetical protein